MQALVRSITVLVLVLSLGLQWALLQTVAWTGMMVSYSQKSSFREAVKMTFDGKHPCPLCKVIKKARAEEKQKEEKQTTKSGSKLDLGLIWQATVLCFSSDRERISSPNTDASIRSYEPPKPRPRAA